MCRLKVELTPFTFLFLGDPLHTTGSCKDRLPGSSLTGTLFRWEEDEIPRLVNVVKEKKTLFMYILLYSEISGYYNLILMLYIYFLNYKFVKEANISMLHGITGLKTDLGNRMKIDLLIT